MGCFYTYGLSFTEKPLAEGFESTRVPATMDAAFPSRDQGRELSVEVEQILLHCTIASLMVETHFDPWHMPRGGHLAIENAALHLSGTPVAQIGGKSF